MNIEIISWSISTKVQDLAGIKLVTPGSAVRLASVARNVTDWATLPGSPQYTLFVLLLYVPVNSYGHVRMIV